MERTLIQWLLLSRGLVWLKGYDNNMIRSNHLFHQHMSLIDRILVQNLMAWIVKHLDSLI